MKKIIVIAAVLTMSVGLVACGGGNPTQKSEEKENNYSVQADSGETETGTEKEAEQKTEKETTGTEAAASAEDEGLDNFDVDKKTVTEFANQIREAVAAKDIEKLADLVSYPTYVGFPDEGIVIQSKEDFVALDQNQVFTEAMLSSINDADVSALEASMAGFTLAKAYEQGIPSITFSIVNGKLGITGINY